MKFRLISRHGVDEGTGEIPNSFAGDVSVLVWNGRSFLAGDLGRSPVEFFEVLGQALDHHQVTPPPKVAERWTSPTAIGRMAEKAPDVVYSVAPGYVLNQTQAQRAAKWKEDQASAPEEERFRWDVVDDRPPARRRRGKPS